MPKMYEAETFKPIYPYLPRYNLIDDKPSTVEGYPLFIAMHLIIVEQSGVDCSFPMNFEDRLETFVEICVQISMLCFFFFL